MSDMEKRKSSTLNKFLTKTFHLIGECDDAVACWSNDGESFTVKDIAAFENEILPQYFNHSNFSSFARQLNFYSFEKVRVDADLQKNTSSVRFCHRHFRRDKPELLHQITRSTARNVASKPSPNTDVKTLREEVRELKRVVRSLSEGIDERVQNVAAAIHEEYMVRFQRMEAYYADLLLSSVPGYAAQSRGESEAATLIQLSGKLRNGDIAKFIRDSKSA